MVGIEVLKADLTMLAKIVKKVDSALEDGKISVVEGIGFAWSAPDLIKIVKTSKEAYEELCDLTSPEKDELIAHFKAEFDLSNDNAEMVVEQVVELALNIAEALGMFKLVEE